jgi:hypothetical protein
MTNAEAQRFAERWIQAWSERDADWVLAQFAEEAEFTSPRALAVVGKATLPSRRELADYWHAALKAVASIQFTLDHVIHDEAARRLAIVYVAEINGKKMRAVEFFEFDAAGKVIRGEAMHGVVEGVA